MALRTIVKKGDPILNKKCRVVTEYNERLHTLIDDMKETLADADGAGLAAPQVTYVMNRLKEKGLDVRTDATTVEEARDEILRALAAGGRV